MLNFYNLGKNLYITWAFFSPRNGTEFKCLMYTNINGGTKGLNKNQVFALGLNGSELYLYFVVMPNASLNDGVFKFMFYDPKRMFLSFK